MSTVRVLARRQAVRAGVGLAVSLAFVLITLSRVDIAGVGHALGTAAPAALATGLLFAWLEVCARAWRWQYLLRPIRPVPYQRSLAYLCIGYFANSILPARLGDVARAYLAGTAFGAPRLATLGTILIERVLDGVSILAIAVALGLVVGAGHPLLGLAVQVAAVAAVAVVALAAVVVAARRELVARSRLGSLVHELAGRIAAGAAAVRRPFGLAVVAAWTLGAFLLAVAAMAALAAAVGIRLDLGQAALVMAAVALSTAIPAAPGSLGTYEFVGLTVLTALGFDPEASLAAILLLHLAGTIPPALVGLAMTWLYHLRVDRLVEQPQPTA